MSLPTYDGNTDYVRAWTDDVVGQADELKYSMDRFGDEFKAWFNDTFIPALPVDFATKNDLQDLVIGEFGENFVTEAMMAFAVTKKSDFDAHKSDNTPHREAASLERKNKDTEGIWTLLEWSRADGTLYKTSTLSGGTSPNYTTRTVKFYDTDGTTLLQTIVYTLSYDVDDELESEVIQV